MIKHPESDQLANAIKRCIKHSAAWNGVVYRSAAVEYANRDDLLTGLGAKTNGARWNPPNSFATVYSSLEVETTNEEALAHARYYGVADDMVWPRVIVKIQVNLQRVLKLTDHPSRRTLGVSRKRLVDEDWRSANAKGVEALTQAIGRLAWLQHLEGLLVPSAAHSGGVNLITFPGNFEAPASHHFIINRDLLPSRRMSVD